MRAFVCLMVLWLSSCTTLDVGTVLAHRNTSSEDFDPRSFRAAILVSENLQPHTEIVVGLALSYAPTADQIGHPIEVAEVFVLEERDEPLTGQRISISERNRIMMFAVAEDDYERALLLRRHAIAAETAVHSSWSQTVEMNTDGASPESVCASLDEQLQVFFRPSDAYRFRPIFKNRTPRQLFGGDEACVPNASGERSTVTMERTP